jgi:hypothetical protein
MLGNITIGVISCALKINRFTGVLADGVKRYYNRGILRGNTTRKIGGSGNTYMDEKLLLWLIFIIAYNGERICVNSACIDTGNNRNINILRFTG